MTSSSTAQIRIAIIGAGIAGLSAAIALQDQPHIDVQIYERTAELREVGATIALGPNGLRILDKLGVSDALEDSVAFRNKTGRSMIYRHHQTDEDVSWDIHQGQVDYRHRTARFYRPHLQRVLLDHIDPARLHLGRAFLSVAPIAPGDEGLVVTFKDGSSVKADIVLGSDGIHSPVRRTFVPSSETQWTGGLFYRSCFPRRHVEHIANLPDEAVHYWGPDHSFFVTPLAQDLYSVVASRQCDTDKPPEDSDAAWDAAGDINLLKEQYKDWSPLVRQIIDATPFTRVYRNTAAPELETWLLGDGRITLAGDAAHAHGGAYAAGGSLAIDDAWAFAQSILHVFPASRAGLDVLGIRDIKRALKLYEKTRKAHTDRVQRTVEERNRALAEARGKETTDEQVRERMKRRDNLAWLHEHDVEAAFAKAVASERLVAVGQTPPSQSPGYAADLIFHRTTDVVA